MAQSFILGESFIKSDDVCLILGDNVFYGNGLRERLQNCVVVKNRSNAVVFGYYVTDPKRYGVVEFDNQRGMPLTIEEKPEIPKSNYAVSGLCI